MLADRCWRELAQPRRIARDCLVEHRTSALEHRCLALIQGSTHVRVGRGVVRAEDDADDAFRQTKRPLTFRPLLEAEVDHRRRVIPGLERT